MKRSHSTFWVMTILGTLSAVKLIALAVNGQWRVLGLAFALTIAVCGLVALFAWDASRYMDGS